MADNEVNRFLKELAGEQPESILDKPLDLGTDEEPEKEAPVRKVELDEDGYAKNRQGRRKRQHDEDLRNEISQLNERVKVLSEADKFKQETGDDYHELLKTIYGNADEKGNYDPKRDLATKNLIMAFDKMKESAKKEFIEAYESRSNEESKAEKEADKEVDEFLDIAEDEGLDIDDDATRSGLVTLMERMSKKYDDGNIKEFADSEAVVEAYKSLQKRGGSSRAKDLADRSMTRSGESQPSKLQENAIETYMRENGLEW